MIRAAAGIHRNAVIGTLAAWSVRYCPFIFAGSVESAAAIAFRALAAQVRDAEHIAAAARKRPRDCASAVMALDGRENVATGRVAQGAPIAAPWSHAENEIPPQNPDARAPATVQNHAAGS